MTHHPNHHPVVYRQLAIPVPVFDHIKDYQRAHVARTGEHLSISQTVAAIVLGHQQNEASAERSKRSNQPAILSASRSTLA